MKKLNEDISDEKARYRVFRFEELPSKLIGSLKSVKQVSSLFSGFLLILIKI